MSIRKTPFVTGEFYHVYNRGVDKRDIFSDTNDQKRFFQSMEEFNSLNPIGSIYEKSFINKRLGSKASKQKKLVNFIAYCLNPNHYHFILQQVADKGIEKFMQRIGTGYTKYFNEKYKRTGSLFQGKFKSIHINSDPYLLHLSAYVNLNHFVHRLGSLASKSVESRSSWGEYTDGGDGGYDFFCEKDIVLGQFNNAEEYKKFANESLQNILKKRYELDGLNDFLLE